MAHSYSHLYGLPTTGLRFFTVYGPWYRPDMALYLFAQAITAGQPINLFNNGNMRRDFTYVDDVVEAMARIIGRPPQGDADWSGAKPDPSSSKAPWKIYNIGNNKPEELMHVVGLLEQDLVARPKNDCCRCSPVTCSRPSPMSTISCATSISGPGPGSKTGSRNSWPGFESTIAFSCSTGLAKIGRKCLGFLAAEALPCAGMNGICLISLRNYSRCSRT